LSPRCTSSFSSALGPYSCKIVLKALMSGTGTPSTYTIRSSGFRSTFSAGEPGMVSSTYGGVRSTTLGTKTMPWKTRVLTTSFFGSGLYFSFSFHIRITLVSIFLPSFVGASAVALKGMA
jgi:hypothetical protein